MSSPRRVLAGIGALALSLFVFSASAPAADPASNATATAAVAWLVTQQQPDGGFEVVGSPGFETPDAVLAIAEQAQTGSSWSTSQAFAAVAALHAGGGSGPTPLDALDDYAATVTTATAAAKLIVADAVPLGLDPAAFDPGNDGAPVDLVALLDVAWPDSGCSANNPHVDTFGGTLFTILAKKLVCGVAPPAAVATVRAAQQADGGWGFTGDPNTAGADPDVIGLALMALAAGGVQGTDPAIQRALALLATVQQPSGAWVDFFGTDGNAASTALVVLGITASGYDAASSCWRDTAAPGKASSAYADPIAWLRSQQKPDGHIASPYDTFGVNTFTTTQAVQGLLRSWLPIVRGSAQACAPAPPTTSTSTPTAGSSITITGDGFGANTTLTIELHSTPVVLATTQTDNTGHYSVTGVIPADTPPGAHEIVIRGLGPNGEAHTSVVSITVGAAAVAVVVVPTFAG
jgi:hypothetical protein